MSTPRFYLFFEGVIFNVSHKKPNPDGYDGYFIGGTWFHSCSTTWFHSSPYRLTKPRSYDGWCYFGRKKRSLSILLFFLVGLVIPVFSGLRSTILVLTGPTAGYVIAWLFVPLLISYGVKLVNKKNFIAVFLIVWLAGVLFVDVAGAIWLASYTNIPLDKSLLQNLVFIPGDTIKAIIAAVVAVKYKDSFS